MNEKHIEEEAKFRGVDVEEIRKVKSKHEIETAKGLKTTLPKNIKKEKIVVEKVKKEKKEKKEKIAPKSSKIAYTKLEDKSNG